MEPAAAPPPLVPTIDPKAGEYMVAAIGIEPFLAKSVKVHGYHHQRAAGIPVTVDRKIHRFLAREEREPPTALPPFDWEAVRDMVNAKAEEGHTQAAIAAFGEPGAGGELGVSADLTVQRIRAYLVQKLPRRVRVTLAGPVEGDPPPSDMARFKRLWAIASAPLSILDDLNEYCLSRDQVQVCRDMYPMLWASFWTSAQNQLLRRRMVDPKYQLDRRKEQLLRILTQQEGPNVALAKAMQAMYAQASVNAKPGGGPAAPKKSGGEPSAAGESSAADRLDASGA